ncbi:MAG TPA: hypothetical protein VG034_20950 [Acidimicrobiia bacterium]|nr:hypothetical protein [Acidimicrobiia bacterium]
MSASPAEARSPGVSRAAVGSEGRCPARTSHRDHPRQAASMRERVAAA